MAKQLDLNWMDFDETNLPRTCKKLADIARVKAAEAKTARNDYHTALAVALRAQNKVPEGMEPVFARTNWGKLRVAFKPIEASTPKAKPSALSLD